MKSWIVILTFFIFIESVLADDGNSHNDSLHNESESHSEGAHSRFQVATLNFAYVATPLIISVWIICASLAKIGMMRFT